MRLYPGFFTVFFLVLSTTSPAFGQPQDATKPLEQILLNLESQKGYRFNYDPQTIRGIRCIPPDPDIGIEQIIKHLEDQTGLTLNLLSNNFISIRSNTTAICGFLIDAETKDPIPFATIWTESQTAISDEKGFFEIQRGSQEVLNFRHVGYLDLQLITEVEPGKCVEFYLELNPQVLPEIVLSDYLITGIDKLKNGSFRIDFEEFSILPGLTDSDVLFAVQAFPGILSISETVSNINIRGGSHDQNLLTWDGIKMYQSGHFFGLISMYNPQITQSVLLRKNGTPIQGTDGVSGTIEMSSERKVNQKLNGNVGVNFTDANGFLDIPVGKKSSVQIAARKSISELVKTPTYAEYFDRISQDTELDSDSAAIVNSNVNFDFWDGSVRWIYEPTPKDKIRVNFIFTGNELIFNENAQVDSQQVSKQSSLNQTSFGGAIHYTRTWSDRHHTTFNIYESDYKLKAINVNLLEDQRFLQENKVSETGVGLTSNYQLAQRVHWRNGYQFVETKVTNLDDVDNPIYRNLVAEVVRAHGVFSGINWQSADGRSSINLGGRLNYLEKFEKFIPEPRLGFNHQLNEYWNIELLGEFKHQYTSQVINFQNDFLGIEKRRWQLSDNDTIPIITSKQVSLGISYGNHGWLLNGVVFHKVVDGISTQSQGFQNQFEFIKSDGSYTASGFDLLIRRQFPHLNTWLSYSYMDNEYTFEELSVQSFPSNFDIRHTLSLGATYNKAPWLLSAGFNWRTGKPTTPPMPPVSEETDIVYGAPNSDRLDDYLRVDMSALFQLITGPSTKLEAGISLWNILDRENAINNYYRLTADGNAEEVVQRSLGFTPNLLCRFYF